MKFAFLFALLSLAACSASPTNTPAPSATATAKPFPTSAYIEATPRAPLNVRGTFVYSAGDGSLWLQAAKGGDPTPLVERSTESIAQLPSYSLDGKRVAYSALL